MATSEPVDALENTPLRRNPLLLEKQSLGVWWRSGEPWIWLTATAVGTSLVAVIGLLLLLAVKGLAHFWPSTVYQIEFENEFGKQVLLGEVSDSETISRRQYLEATLSTEDGLPDEIDRILYKTGNRQVNPPDFRWVFSHQILTRTAPDYVVSIERREWGNAYAFLQGLSENRTPISTDDIWVEFQSRIQRASDLLAEQEELQDTDVRSINYELEQLRLERRRRELTQSAAALDFSDLDQRTVELQNEYAGVEQQIRSLSERLERDIAHFQTVNGKALDIHLSEVVQAWQPNNMSFLSKLGTYCVNIWKFLTDNPREANTEGGIFPALFGTVLMVLLMSVFVTPFGVIAAVYLREYAKQGPFVRLIRIAVNNLAGVPSIVYGVFGLGFFVYLIGGTLDDLFFPEAKPAPTFGTPGLLWASLTLALLTVPVVIVSTEEGLTRIPRAVREGSLALGATKAETLFKVVLPMASPSILTGIILAVARAAGEVAPLMLVGVVKLAPTLPVDGNFPFLHLERKFMHLGFHIYDVGFQSPNVDAARPLVFATALLLVLIIILLNLTAIMLRNRLEARFRLDAH